MYILVLESSTSSAKAMLYNASDNTYEIETKSYPLYFNNSTLHDAEGVFQMTAALGKHLCAGKKIDAVSLGGTWHSVMLCGADFNPVTPVYLWSNTEASEICKRLREDSAYVHNFYQRTGCMVNAIYPFFKLKLFRDQGYRLEDYYIAGQGAYNNFRLTGEKIETDSMASGTGLLNIHTKQYDNDMLAEAGINESNLARLITYKDSYPLTEESARLLGITPGIPVIPACPDGGLNQVGSGALEEGVMTLSFGTSGALRLTVKSPALPDNPSTWCYLSPKTWLSGAAISGCGNCVDWYKNNMFPPDTSYADIESGFNEAHDTPVFLPFLFGERCPGWQDDRSGGFLGMAPRHTPFEFFQSVLDGIVFNMYQCYKVLTDLNGIPKKVKLSGGILNSAYWTQMCCDVFGIEMEVDNSKHGSLMGAAALGLEKTGAISSASEFTVASNKIIRPDPRKSKLLAEKYSRYLYWYEKTNVKDWINPMILK